MKNNYTNSEIDLIINKINSLYPDFKIAGITRSDQDYIIEIVHDPNVLGSGGSQKWTIKENKAVFIDAFSKR